jgi:hypothetical protein
MNIEESWAKKRAAFFASNPNCTVCGGGFDHYSRTMICRKCQIIKYKNTARAKEPKYSRAYRRKHWDRIQAYQKQYYLANKVAISLRKSIKYHEYKQTTASYI